MLDVTFFVFWCLQKAPTFMTSLFSYQLHTGTKTFRC